VVAASPFVGVRILAISLFADAQSHPLYTARRDGGVDAMRCSPAAHLDVVVEVLLLTSISVFTTVSTMGPPSAPLDLRLVLFPNSMLTGGFVGWSGTVESLVVTSSTGVTSGSYASHAVRIYRTKDCLALNEGTSIVIRTGRQVRTIRTRPEA